MDEFRQFSISSYGWLKLGARNRSNSLFTEDSIIHVFGNGVSLFNCTYKLVGDAPYRRFVVEWSGTFSGGSQPVKFQLWLHETIPGDYPTINALLQDAVCKHMGPNLVIELQPNYSFAAEGGVVRFKPVHVNKFIQSITIRPAASATNLLLSNTGAYPLLMVDSVPFVHIDGRAGGTGTTNPLTISQTDIYQPAIAFVNNAKNGGVHFTNIQGNSKNSSNGLLLLTARDPLNFGVNYANGAHYTTIDHCKIGPASGFTYRALVVKKGDNNIIRSNEFFRFFMDAINYTEGGLNSQIVNNRLYQPELMPAQDGNNASSSAGAIVLTNMKNNCVVDSNRLGGNSPVWGIGSWQQSINTSSSGYALIRLTQSSVEPGTTTYFRYNETALSLSIQVFVR